MLYAREHSQYRFIRIREQQHDDRSAEELQRIAADEYIAYIAQERTPKELEQNVWQQVVDRVHRWLAEHGFVLAMDGRGAEGVIDSLLRESYAKLRKGESGNVNKDGRSLFRIKRKNSQQNLSPRDDA